MTMMMMTMVVVAVMKNRLDNENHGLSNDSSDDVYDYCPTNRKKSLFDSFNNKKKFPAGRNNKIAQPASKNNTKKRLKKLPY
jgi:hypothetical protein